MFRTKHSLPSGSGSLHTHTAVTLLVLHRQGRSRATCDQHSQHRLGFFSWHCYPKKTLLFFSGQYGKWCPVSWGKGQRHFKVKKGHLCHLNPIQSDILPPKEQEKKNPYLLYFCIFLAQLHCCIPSVELCYVFKQEAGSPSLKETDIV